MDTPTPPASSTAEAPEPRPPAWRRHWIVPVTLVALLITAIFGLRWYLYSRTHVSTDDAQIESDIYPISARVSGHISAVHVDTNDQVKAGEVLAEIDPEDYRTALHQAEAALAQAVSGAHAAGGTVRVTEQTGGAGIAEAEAAVAAARAMALGSLRESEAAAGRVEEAGAAESAASAAVEMARREATSAKATVESARAVAQQAQQDVVRARELVARGAISGQQSDTAEATNATAQANLAAARARASAAEAAVTQAQAKQRQAASAVTQARRNAAAAQAMAAQAQAAVGEAEARVKSSQASPQQVAVRRSEAKSANAQVAAARARLEQARLNLSYTRIVAPIDGTVAQKNLKLGQYVQAGQPLVALTPVSPQYIVANYKETQLEGVKVGQKATFAVDAYPGVTFSGTVESLSPGTGAIFSLLPPENATGNFTKVVQRVPVRILIDRDSLRLRPLRQGMSVIATVNTGPVPSGAEGSK